MSSAARYSVANPRLGTLFSIFTSALIGSLVLLIICEQLGLSRFWISHIACIAPLLLAAGFSVATVTNNTTDLYVCGRRVPPSFSGFNLATAALGGTGLLSLTGLFFLIGFDTVSLSLGWCLGFVLMALLYAPNIRRADAHSLPGFFSERFKSRMTGAIAAILILPPLLFVLIAELKIAAFAAFLIIGISPDIILATVAALILILVLPGGMRSLTWSGAACFIIVLVGFLLPLLIVSIYLTNIPIPQITYGTLLDDLTRYEISNGISPSTPTSIGVALGGDGPEKIDKLFLQSFGTLSLPNFTIIMLCFMCGVATFPTLLMRANTVASAHQARRAAGWGMALLGVFLISAPAYAVFVKFMFFENLIGATIDQLPDWARDLINLQLLEIRDKDQNASLGVAELYVNRDGLPFILPIIAGLPFAVIVLTVTAALAASTTSASAQAFTISTSIVRGLSSTALSNDTFYTSNHLTLRLVVVAITIAGALGASMIETDPLWLIAWALSLSGSTFFAPLTLAIFWSGFTARGATVSMLTGACLSGLVILLSQNSASETMFGVNHLVAGIIGIPASFVTAILFSSFGASKTASTPDTDQTPDQRQYGLRQSR